MPWGEAKRTMRTTPRLVGADGRSGRAGVTSVCPVSTGRMEAFSDGVIAILITVMVLELPIPHGTTWGALREAVPVLLSYVLSFVYLGIYWNNHHHMLQATDRVSGLMLWANLHLLFWLSLVPFVTSWLGENHFAATPAAAYGIVLLAYVLSFVYLGIYWNNHHHMLQATHRVSGLILWANLHLLFWLSLVPFSTSWLGENQLATVPAAAYGINLLASALAYYALQLAIIRDQGEGSVLATAVGRDWKGKASPVVYAVGIGLAFVSPVLAVVVYVGLALLWLVPDRRLERTITATGGFPPD